MSIPAKPISPAEIVSVIQKRRPKKSPGHDKITNKIAKNLSKKYSVIIMIAKPNKPKHLVSSFRPISLLPTFAKLFEKLIQHRITPIIDQHNILPKSQFGFRRKYNTIHQIHRITDKISASFETKQYCTGAFLDISQAFDRNIKAGVPQGHYLSPILYNIFTADLPKSNQTLLASFADDTAILTSNKFSDIASQHLKLHLNKIESWAKNWKIKINDEKSAQVNFSLNKRECPPLKFNNKPIPVHQSTKYLDITLDKRLTWSNHTKQKRKQLNSRLHLLRPILKSNLSLKNKLFLYKVIIRPVWPYAIRYSNLGPI
ncbi:Uncharacterized protein FWK35_00014605 [Aphis craccivora]|uniref:Reverse transcriptase domain-containing protein n=1 Tax=Aphis craccivora TaxID=307492 RepID=A0A6G0YJM1_APHCR|nr:Uncharacterized protein FWK35_00014605 [Aphis craccivora]